MNFVISFISLKYTILWNIKREFFIFVNWSIFLLISSISFFNFLYTFSGSYLSKIIRINPNLLIITSSLLLKNSSSFCFVISPSISFLILSNVFSISPKPILSFSFIFILFFLDNSHNNSIFGLELFE